MIEDRTCVVCGRRIAWRRSLARDWEHVTTCSQRCRRTGIRPIDHELETVILELLSARAHGATICPSEAARIVGGENWRSLMEPARMAARRLVHAGSIEVLQRGRAVDPSTAKGPIRLRRRTA